MCVILCPCVCVSHTALSVKARFLAPHSFIPTLHLYANTQAGLHAVTNTQTNCGGWGEKRERTSILLYINVLVHFKMPHVLNSHNFFDGPNVNVSCFFFSMELFPVSIEC